jgi:peptide/nickel transport system permease protein
LPLKSPTQNFLDTSNGRPPYSPSWKHWFGTDKDARDVFARTLHGARISLAVGFAAITAGFLVGGTVGVISGYYKGWIDRISSFVFIVLLSFPSLVLAILLTSLIERSLLTIGATNRRIIIKEILPNVAIPMSSLALLGMAVAVVAEGGLSFLGLSVEKGITWGGLIQLGSESSKTLEEAPWIAFFPILMLFLTVLSLNFAGDRVRNYFDVKETTL